MNDRIHPWKLGLFVIIAGVSLVGTAFYVGVNRGARDSLIRTTYFDESVQGLDLGAPVKMRGVEIGKVKYISIASDHRLVQVDTELYLDLLESAGLLKFVNNPAINLEQMQSDLRVQLATAGITGVKFIQVDFFESPPPPIELPFDPPIGYVPSIPSTLKNLEVSLFAMAQKLPHLMENMDEAFTILKGKMREIDLPPLIAQVNSILETVQEEFKIADEGPGLVQSLRTTLDEAQATLNSVRTTFDSLNGQGGAVERMVGTVEEVGDRVATLSGQAGGLVKRLETLSGHADQALSDADIANTVGAITELSGKLGQAADQASATLESLLVVTNTSADLPEAINVSLGELRLALNAFRRLADLLERQPSALLRGRSSESSAPQNVPRRP